MLRKGSIYSYEYSPVLPDLRSVIIYFLYDLALASSMNGLHSSLGQKRVASKLCQTIPRRKATVLLDNKTLKRSLAVHFQSYPLALAEKGQQQPELSLVTMTPPNQQSPFQSREMLNRYGESWTDMAGTQNVSNQIVAFCSKALVLREFKGKKCSHASLVSEKVRWSVDISHSEFVLIPWLAPKRTLIAWFHFCQFDFILVPVANASTGNTYVTTPWASLVCCCSQEQRSKWLGCCGIHSIISAFITLSTLQALLADLDQILVRLVVLPVFQKVWVDVYLYQCFISSPSKQALCISLWTMRALRATTWWTQTAMWCWTSTARLRHWPWVSRLS